MKEALQELLTRLDAIETVFGTDIDWETKFDLIFEEHSQAVVPLLNRLGLTIEWCDPDTTYQEDVTAYVQAAMPVRDEVRRLLEAFDKPAEEAGQQ